MKKAHDGPAVRAAERLNHAVDDFRRHLRSESLVGAPVALAIVLALWSWATGG